MAFDTCQVNGAAILFADRVTGSMQARNPRGATPPHDHHATATHPHASE